MLTADLVRARMYKGVVKPTYLRGKNANAAEYAQRLCALYARAHGWSRADLDEALQEIVGDAPDFQLARGLAKLLDDRCTWASRAEHPPQELRAALYDAAFKRTALQEGAVKTQRRPRQDVLQEVGAALDLSAEQIDASMFADHRDDERLVEYKALDEAALLARYDVALAQAVLLRANRVRIRVHKATAQQLRQLITALKFHQLLFSIDRDDASNDWVLEIDGPTSILQRATRYGLQLALLVPVLLHFKRWSLDAEVRWPRQPTDVRFELSHKDKLAPVSRLRGAWVSEEQKLLEERIEAHKTPWNITRAPELMTLGARDLFAPEITLEHPDGRKVYVEIVGTWRRHWLRTRLDLLRAHGPPNTVLCVSRSLAAEKETLKDFDGEIVEFAQIISLPKLLKAAEKVAIDEA